MGIFKTNNNASVVVESPTLEGFGNSVRDGLTSAGDYVRSLEGTSTVDEDLIESVNVGFKYTVEYKAYSKEYQFGIYSTDENSAGMYSTLTTNIGAKFSSDPKKSFLPTNDSSFSKFSFFALANSSNIFNKETVSNDTKFKGGLFIKPGTPFSLMATYEKSLMRNTTNKSFGVEVGNSMPVKFESSIINSTTIFKKTKEFKLSH